MTRTALPSRRPSLSCDTAWQGHPITVTVGFDATGAVRECFANTPEGGHMAATIADACVIISIALQHGIAPDALAKSLGLVPDPSRGKDATQPASPLGTVMGVVCGPWGTDG